MYIIFKKNSKILKLKLFLYIFLNASFLRFINCKIFRSKYILVYMIVKSRYEILNFKNLIENFHKYL